MKKPLLFLFLSAWWLATAPAIVGDLLVGDARAQVTDYEALVYTPFAPGVSGTGARTAYNPGVNATVDSVWNYLLANGTVAGVPCYYAQRIHAKAAANLPWGPYTRTDNYGPRNDELWPWKVAGAFSGANVSGGYATGMYAAGSNITISHDTISASGAAYVAGSNITITGDTISAAGGSGGAGTVTSFSTSLTGLSVATATTTPALSGTLGVASGGTGAATTSQNFAFIGPTSGSGAASYRALVLGDLPSSAGAGLWLRGAGTGSVYDSGSGNYTNQAYSIVAGYQNNATDNSNGGNSAVFGSYDTCYSNNSLVFGDHNTAGTVGGTGEFDFVGGWNNFSNAYGLDFIYGYGDTATGPGYSTLLGTHVLDGAKKAVFVYGDGSAKTTATADSQFVARAKNGYNFYDDTSQSVPGLALNNGALFEAGSPVQVSRGLTNIDLANDTVGQYFTVFTVPAGYNFVPTEFSILTITNDSGGSGAIYIDTIPGGNRIATAMSQTTPGMVQNAVISNPPSIIRSGQTLYYTVSTQGTPNLSLLVNIYLFGYFYKP